MIECSSVSDKAKEHYYLRSRILGYLFGSKYKKYGSTFKYSNC